MKNVIYFLVCCLISAQTFAQTPIIFRPGPGANDSTDQGGLTAGKDTWVYEGNAINYGDLTYIEALPISNCNATNCVAYIQFDLSTLPLGVDSVFIVFNHYPHTNYCYSACNADFYFARVLDPWNEMGMTYATQPSHDTAFYGPINITFPNNFGVREYNITSAYSLWRSEQAPNYGMAIYSTTVDCNNAAVFFSVSSSDDTIVTERPYLKVYPHNITGVENTLQSNVNLVVYPNPAIEKASLEFTLAEMQQVKCWVYDLNGRAVFSTESIMPKGFNKISIPMSDLAPGLYIYDLTMKEGVVSGKLLRN